MMNISILGGHRSGSLIRRATLALTLASAIGLLAATPALAERNDGHGRNQQRAEQQRNHGQKAWQGERRNYRQPSRDSRSYYSNRPYYYAQPVYVPPPVYYEPQQSPGISLFFPLDLRR
jgi:hypothetical protein